MGKTNEKDLWVAKCCGATQRVHKKWLSFVPGQGRELRTGICTFCSKLIKFRPPTKT